MPDSINNALQVLDSWPVMQWFRAKPGGDIFEILVAEAETTNRTLCISRMNLGEVYYLVAKDYTESAASALIHQLQSFPIEIVSVTDDDIDAAALIKGRYSISYADAFTAALGMKRLAPIVTGDKDFLPLAADGLVQLRWVGL